MLNWFFTWLEARVDAFPQIEPQMPKPTTWGFIRHYTKPFVPLVVVGLLLSVAIAIIEVRLFAYVGRLVDVLSKADRTDFWDQHKYELLFYGSLAIIVQPLLSGLGDSIENQGLRANFAMRTRWLGHRYMLRQSMEFFHNEFAGRVATKVLQAALGVRDVVMKLTGVNGIAETKIAFKRNTGARSSEIYVADFDGYNAKPVTQDNTDAAAPCSIARAPSRSSRPQ